MEEALQEEGLHASETELLHSPDQRRKEKKIVYKSGIQPAMVKETPAIYGGDLWARLSQSKFRSGFSLKANDRYYVADKGMELVRSHARDFVKKRRRAGIIGR